MCGKSSAKKKEMGAQEDILHNSCVQLKGAGYICCSCKLW